jgi:hypothetical protein
VLKRIFGSKRDEGAGGWRPLHSECLHNLYSSPDIISVIKSRRTISNTHETRREEKKNAYKILNGKLEGKNHLEDTGVDGKIITVK